MSRVLTTEARENYSLRVEDHFRILLVPFSVMIIGIPQVGAAGGGVYQQIDTWDKATLPGAIGFGPLIDELE